jgi:hypothetical protein
MNTEILQQHELLKTALEATDNYLSVKKAAMDKGMATNNMLHDFSYHMSRAHDALQTLGVLDKHEPYMAAHTEDLLKLHGHKDSTIADLPYAHVPKADMGEVEEETQINELKKSTLKNYIHKAAYDMAHRSSDKATAAAHSAIYGLSKDTAEKEKAEKQRKEIHSKISKRAKGITTAAYKLGEENHALSFLTFLENEELFFTENDLQEIEKGVIESLDVQEENEAEELVEKISAQSRLKKRQSFRRQKPKRSAALNIKIHRAASTQTLMKRAVVAARNSLYRRILRGRSKSSLSPAEKDRVEQQVKKLKYIQSTIASRMLPKLRSIEQKRLAGYRSKK